MGEAYTDVHPYGGHLGEAVEVKVNMTKSVRRRLVQHKHDTLISSLPQGWIKLD